MATDGNIHFPPGQRRDKPSFEPPPWERDQFDDLARRRQESEPSEPAAEEGLDVSEVAGTSGEPAEAEAVSPLPDADAEQPDGLVETADVKPELDPKQVEMLMMGLRAEEPRADEAYWKVSVIAGAFSALIGLMVVTWGLVALAAPKGNAAGTGLMVVMLLGVGIAFIAVGVWIVFKSLRQQGVL